MNASLLSNISAIVLLVISPALGFMDKSVEMGLAIVAGAIGLAFSNIDKICSFEGAGFKAEMWKKMETVVEKETETDQDLEIIKSVSLYSASDIDADENKILEVLNNQKYTWRTLSGIRKATDVSEGKVEKIINELTKKGDVKEFKGSKGGKGKTWSLTSLGRRKLVVNVLVKEKHDESLNQGDANDEPTG